MKVFCRRLFVHRLGFECAGSKVSFFVLGSKVSVFASGSRV